MNLWPDDMHTPWVPEFKQKDNKSWNTEEAFIPVLAEMDKQIGRLIKALDELGLSENTIVISLVIMDRRPVSNPLVLLI